MNTTNSVRQETMNKKCECGRELVYAHDHFKGYPKTGKFSRELFYCTECTGLNCPCGGSVILEKNYAYCHSCDEKYDIAFCDGNKSDCGALLGQKDEKNSSFSKWGKK